MTITWEDVGDRATSSGNTQLSKAEKTAIAEEWNANDEALKAENLKIQATEAHKISAKVKLEALGLTTDEVEAAFGI